MQNAMGGDWTRERSQTHRPVTAEAAMRDPGRQVVSPLRGSNRLIAARSHGYRHGLNSAATPWLNRWVSAVRTHRRKPLHQAFGI